MLIFSFPFSLLLCVQNSFKNFAYLRICLMACNKDMFTSTFLNVSKISMSTSSIFLLGMALGGKGRGMEGAAVEVEGVGVTLDVEGPTAWASRFLWSVAGSSSFSGVGWAMGTSIFFPDLNVMALTFLIFSTICDGSLSEFWACAWF